MELPGFWNDESWGDDSEDSDDDGGDVDVDGDGDGDGDYDYDYHDDDDEDESIGQSNSGPPILAGDFQCLAE